MPAKTAVVLPRLPISSLGLLCAVTLMGGVAYGQRKGNPPVTNSPPALSLPQQDLGQSAFDLDQVPVVVNAEGKPIATTEYTCFLPPLNSLKAATVGIADLKVPANARGEYDNGCSALRKKKFAEAEKHLRKALAQYDKYAAAWVLLGQVQEAQQKREEARDACSRSLTVDSKYLPGLLCLTAVSANQQKWNDVLKFSAQAIEFDPITSAAGYVYNATANLHLRHLPEAEKSALKALQIDSNHSEPRLHFLLAQIYAAQRDYSNEAVQLREFLKFAKDPEDVALAKNDLARLDTSAK